MLAIEYHVHIWKVSPHLSCGETCQIWMWYKESNKYFGRIKNVAYGDINEQGSSNHIPVSPMRMGLIYIHLPHQYREMIKRYVAHLFNHLNAALILNEKKEM